MELVLSSVVKSLINEYGFLFGDTIFLLPKVDSMNNSFFVFIDFLSFNIIFTMSLILPSYDFESLLTLLLQLDLG